MQDKDRCYNKIYCCFDQEGKKAIEILEQSFIDYLKNTENKKETLEYNAEES